jgi:hypothetical protein
MQKSYRRAAISRRETMRLIGASAGLLAGAAGSNPFGDATAAAASSPHVEALHPEKNLIDVAPDMAPGIASDLAKLTAENFERLVGESFAVDQYQVTLRRVRRGPKSGSGFRNQFALVFKLPHAVPIGSEVLPVTHPAIGRHDLLVTQTADAVDGTVLEICFS